MKQTHIAVAALAVLALLVSAGAAAAAPGNSGADQSGERGPPSDLPGPVPDFVSSIHEAIGDFLNGTIDSLGDAVSDLTPGERPADAGNNSTGNETATPTPQ